MHLVFSLFQVDHLTLKVCVEFIVLFHTDKVELLVKIYKVDYCNSCRNLSWCSNV